MPSAHTSRDFETEMRELRAQTLAMGARCERILQIALEAFWQGSAELAVDVETLDRQIDRDEMDIDALVLRILALRQPVAYDLRFLSTALKLVTDLERIGDEAVNIAERTREGATLPEERLQAELRQMAQDAQEMLRLALDAFVHGDVSRAEQVLRRDDGVDAAYRNIVGAAVDLMRAEPAAVAAGVRILNVAKAIERIGDHATNIAEEVIFMVRGEDVRHVRTHPPPP